MLCWPKSKSSQQRLGASVLLLCLGFFVVSCVLWLLAGENLCCSPVVMSFQGPRAEQNVFQLPEEETFSTGFDVMSKLGADHIELGSVRG